jgi:long-chain fatty acid transport protein
LKLKNLFSEILTLAFVATFAMCPEYARATGPWALSDRRSRFGNRAGGTSGAGVGGLGRWKENHLMRLISGHQAWLPYLAKHGSMIICAAILVLVSALRGIALGSGLLLYPTDLGTASAGQAAIAEDASTTASNPAGMTKLDRTQLLTAPGALLPSLNFDVGPQTTTKGTAGGNAGVFLPSGSFFYVYKLSERVRLGVGVYSDFGLAVDYSSRWVGRYYATNESLITSKLAPSIAYALNDWLSVGAGFNFSVARLEFKSKVNNLLPRLGDGGLSFESWDEEFGGNAGILVTPTANLRVGVTYQSPDYFNFGFRPFLANLGPGLAGITKRIGGAQFSVPLTEPQQVMASALYKVLPNFNLMGNVGWQNWQEFGEFPVGISAKNQRTLNANLHFSNTCQIAVGQQLRFAEKWMWSAGFAYDSSPVSQANRSAVLPLDRQLRYGTGLQYDINRDLTVGGAWTLMDAGPSPFNNTRGPLAGTLQGHYSTNFLNFAALTLNWKF